MMSFLYYPAFWQKKTSFLSFILLPFALIYSILAYLRYYLTIEKKLPAKVISIGNITIGGTGKTQLTIFLAKELKKKGIPFAIISKGYGRKCSTAILATKELDASKVGDEALELCKYGDVIVARKVLDAIPLLLKLKAEVVIIDDGLQNSSFHKDYSVVTLDSKRWFGNSLPIPSGPIRMPYIINKVDAVVIVGNDYDHTKPDLQKDTYHAAIISDINLDRISSYYAFAGIGDPERFFASLRLAGIKVISTKIFPNHHSYSQKDVDKIIKYAKDSGLKIITTEKDYVKLLEFNCKDIISYKVSLSFEEKEKFINSIYEKLSISK